jgi:hypothetical protein
MKKSTVYAMVPEMPHYKIGNLLRFKKVDIDTWIQSKKIDGASIAQVKKIRKGKRQSMSSRNNVNSIVKRAIDEVNGKGYNSDGKSDPVKGLGKEAKDGII